MTDSRQHRFGTDPHKFHSENPTKAWLRLIARDVVRRLFEAKRGSIQKTKTDNPANGGANT